MHRFFGPSVEGTICGTFTKMNPAACLNRVRLLRSVLLVISNAFRFCQALLF